MNVVETAGTTRQKFELTVKIGLRGLGELGEKKMNQSQLGQKANYSNDL